MICLRAERGIRGRDVLHCPQAALRPFVVEICGPIGYSSGMGVLKGVLGWILGDDATKIEMEALPDESAQGDAAVPIFLTASDLRASVPAEYLRADAPFVSDDVRIKSSEFLDFSPTKPLRIPAFKLALWCPQFVSIPGGMKGEETVEFPESVLLRSVALNDPAGGEIDDRSLGTVASSGGGFVPLSKGTPGSGDALGDETGDPFGDPEGERFELSQEELEETRRALRETLLVSVPAGTEGTFESVLKAEQDGAVTAPSADEPPRADPGALDSAPVRQQTSTIAAAKERPPVTLDRKPIPNVHRIMKAYLQQQPSVPAERETTKESPVEPVKQGGKTPTKDFSEEVDEISVAEVVKKEREIRTRSMDETKDAGKHASNDRFNRLEKALALYPTVTGVSVRMPEGDFSSGDTSGYVDAGSASEEIRRSFSLTGSMSIRGEAVTCLTVFNETDAVTVLCSRKAQVSIIHGSEGLPLSARRAASRWLTDLSI